MMWLMIQYNNVIAFVYGVYTIIGYTFDVCDQCRLVRVTVFACIPTGLLCNLHNLIIHGNNIIYYYGAVNN